MTKDDLLSNRSTEMGERDVKELIVFILYHLYRLNDELTSEGNWDIYLIS